MIVRHSRYLTFALFALEGYSAPFFFCLDYHSTFADRVWELLYIRFEQGVGGVLLLYLLFLCKTAALDSTGRRGFSFTAYGTGWISGATRPL
jgi:hypothetical protein